MRKSDVGQMKIIGNSRLAYFFQDIKYESWQNPILLSKFTLHNSYPILFCWPIIYIQFLYDSIYINSMTFERNSKNAQK